MSEEYTTGEYEEEEKVNISIFLVPVSIEVDIVDMRFNSMQIQSGMISPSSSSSSWSPDRKQVCANTHKFPWIPERVYYYNFRVMLGELPHNSSLSILVWSIASSSLSFSTTIVSFLRDGTNKWKIPKEKYRKKECRRKENKESYC